MSGPSIAGGGRVLVTAAHWQESPVARCRTCRWARVETAGASWLAVRAAARRHVRTTGHHVWLHVVQAYAYRLDDPLPEPAP